MLPPNGINLNARAPMITQEAMTFVGINDYTNYPQVTSYQQNGANIFDHYAKLVYMVNAGSLSAVNSITNTGTPVFFSLTGQGIGTYTTMSAAACKNVDIYNNTGANVWINRGAAPAFILATGFNKTFHVQANSNELSYSSITTAPVSVEAWG